ncbi:MAG TPA: hypothetical protein VN909_00475, partial [Candidatus Dormibacteraeota bacterium]|nr:hypothetical protein [Candidatus Dormibacteraeota bacterium]
MKRHAFWPAGLLFALSACGGSVPVASPSSPAFVRTVHAFACRTLDDAKDPAFNELNGINDRRIIAGDDGLGHGYVAAPPYRRKDYRFLGFPGAEATTVAGIDARREIVGFYKQGTTIFGFLLTGGTW